MFIILSTMWCNLNVFGMGRLNPSLSFFGGGWDAVVILVEGCGSLWGRLGVEKRVRVSFIRAEAATEAMVVSMDSSSKSSISNESTRETSLVTSATVLNETSLIGVGALGSFVGVGTLGLVLKYCYVFGLWIGKNVWKSSERVLKHTPVCLFGQIIGN